MALMAQAMGHDQKAQQIRSEDIKTPHANTALTGFDGERREVGQGGETAAARGGVSCLDHQRDQRGLIRAITHRRDVQRVGAGDT
jgi:hypothetical protein